MSISNFTALLLTTSLNIFQLHFIPISNKNDFVYPDINCGKTVRTWFFRLENFRQLRTLVCVGCSIISETIVNTLRQMGNFINDTIRSSVFPLSGPLRLEWKKFATLFKEKNDLRYEIKLYYRRQYPDTNEWDSNCLFDSSISDAIRLAGC